MASLKYTVIKNKTQYDAFCNILEEFSIKKDKSNGTKDEIELLTLLIEKWDQDHNSFEDVDPVTLLKALMQEKQINSKDLAQILDVSKGLVSDILSYKKGLSKDVIRRLATYFKVSQEAFNRTYDLQIRETAHHV